MSGRISNYPYSNTMDAASWNIDTAFTAAEVMLRQRIMEVAQLNINPYAIISSGPNVTTASIGYISTTNNLLLLLEDVQ